MRATLGLERKRARGYGRWNPRFGKVKTYAMATSVDSLSSWSTAGEITKYGLLLFDHSLNAASNES